MSRRKARPMSYYYTPQPGCWAWRGCVDADGYGVYGTTSAHRRVYESLVGAIPNGLELDHLCRNRLCVNPSHLEPVTHAENMRRAAAIQTHCKRGHEFTPENTYTYHGRRTCRACNAAHQRAIQARRRFERHAS